MRVLFSLVFIILLIFNSTLKTEISKNDKTLLIGKWKYSEFFIDPGDGSGKWHKVPDSVKQYTIFNKNGNISGNFLTKAISFKIKRKKTVVVVSNDKTIENYFYEINKKKLTLIPGYPSFCFEGCSYRFIKIE